MGRIRGKRTLKFRSPVPERRVERKEKKKKKKKKKKVRPSVEEQGRV